MPNLSSRFRVDSITALDPAWEYQEAKRLGLSADVFLGKANSYRSSCGIEPARAYLLLTYSDLQQLVRSKGNALAPGYNVSVDDGHNIVEIWMHLVRSKAVYPSLSQDNEIRPDAVFLAEFQDTRFLVQKTGTGTLPSPTVDPEDDPREFINHSLLDVLRVLWDRGISSYLGAFPYIVGRFPNLKYRPGDMSGLNAWTMFNHVLDSIGWTITLVPDGRPVIFPLGANPDWRMPAVVGLTGTNIESVFNTLQEAGRPLDVATDGPGIEYLPEKYTVFFPSDYYDYENAFDPLGLAINTSGDAWYHRPAFSIEVPTAIGALVDIFAGSGKEPRILPDTNHPIWSSLHAVYELNGTIKNLNDLEQTAYALALNQSRWDARKIARAHVIYSGVVPLMPSPLIGGIAWYDIGDGLKTEIISDPVRMKPDGLCGNLLRPIEDQAYTDIPSPPDKNRAQAPYHRDFLGVLQQEAPEELELDAGKLLNDTVEAAAHLAQVAASKIIPWVPVQSLAFQPDNPFARGQYRQGTRGKWTTGRRNIMAVNFTGRKIPAGYRVYCTYNWSIRGWIIVGFWPGQKEQEKPEPTEGSSSRQRWTFRCDTAELPEVDTIADVQHVVVRKQSYLQLLRIDDNTVLLNLRGGNSGTVLWTPDGFEPPIFTSSPKLTGSLTVGWGGAGWLKMESPAGVTWLGPPQFGVAPKLRLPSAEDARPGSTLVVKGKSGNCIQLGFDPPGLNGTLYLFGSLLDFERCCCTSTSHCVQLTSCADGETTLVTSSPLNGAGLNQVVKRADNDEGCWRVTALDVEDCSGAVVFNVTSDPPADDCEDLCPTPSTTYYELTRCDSFTTKVVEEDSINNFVVPGLGTVHRDDSNVCWKVTDTDVTGPADPFTETAGFDGDDPCTECGGAPYDGCQECGSDQAVEGDPDVTIDWSFSDFTFGAAFNENNAATTYLGNGHWRATKTITCDGNQVELVCEWFCSGGSQWLVSLTIGGFVESSGIQPIGGNGDYTAAFGPGISAPALADCLEEGIFPSITVTWHHTDCSPI